MSEVSLCPNGKLRSGNRGSYNSEQFHILIQAGQMLCSRPVN